MFSYKAVWEEKRAKEEEEFRGKLNNLLLPLHSQVVLYLLAYRCVQVCGGGCFQKPGYSKSCNLKFYNNEFEVSHSSPKI